jgi:hypothetical protein
VFSLDNTAVGVSAAGQGFSLRENRSFGSATEDMIQTSTRDTNAYFPQTDGPWGTEIAVFKAK